MHWRNFVAGLILGAIGGIALGKRNDSIGKAQAVVGWTLRWLTHLFPEVIRGAGTLVKGIVDAVGKAGKSPWATKRHQEPSWVYRLLAHRLLITYYRLQHPRPSVLVPLALLYTVYKI